MLNKKRKEKTLAILKDLIKAESSSGKEEKAVKTAAQKAEDLNFDQLEIDKYGSLIAKINGQKKGKNVLLDAHIDTVGVNRKDWSVDPFKAVVKDNKLYGRGSSDMKGALAAMLAAASFFKEDHNFSGQINVSAVVFEELFEGVAARNISEIVKPDYVIIGEASELKLMRGQRGRAEIVLETEGKSAHSASPQKGVNAVYQMLKLVEAVKELDLGADEELGRAIMELTDIISAPYPGSSVIPNKCQATFDRRLLLNEDAESILAELKSVLKRLNIEGSAYLAEAEGECWTGKKIGAARFFPAWLLAEDSKLLQAGVKALDSIGLPAEVSTYSFCTNGSHYAGEKNIPTIGFGPSKEELAHTADEYLELKDLYQAVEGYYAILKELLK